MSSMRSASSRTSTRTDAERDEPPLEQVVEPAGRRDEQLRAARLLRLTADRRAAVDRRDPQVARRGERLQLVDDLRGELAGRDEHERAAGCPSAPAVRSIIGIPNASVLPEPVGDAARTSTPASASGRTSAWIANGEVDAEAVEHLDDSRAHTERSERL